MEIKQVTIGLGTTVNIGNYESTRVDVSITAEMTQGEYDADGMDTLDKLVREELAYRLWDYAEVELSAADVFHWKEERRTNMASRRSPYFAHMLKFAPHIATGLLTSLVEDAEEKKRAEEAAKAEAARPADGQYVVDLGGPDEAAHDAFSEFT